AFHLRILHGMGTLLLCHTALFAQSGPARLARGIEKFDSGRYAEAVQDLKAAQPLLPKLSDYVAYDLASAHTELKDFAEVRKDLAVFRTLPAPSPLSAKAAVLDARAATETGAPDAAISLLRQRYEELPQPAGDFTLAQAYEAAHEPAQAAIYYQRVY